MKKIFQERLAPFIIKLKSKYFLNSFVLSYVTYIILVIFFYNSWLYSIGPDFISQVSIAHKYANGHYFDAINGWWSPLFNLLLAFFFKLGFNDFNALKAINIVGGFWLIYFVYKLINLYEKKAVCFLPALVPLITFYVLSSDGSDLISLLLFFTFLHQLQRLKLQPDITNAFLTGITCSLSYLTKTYNLYYCTIILLIFFLGEWGYFNFRFNKNVMALLLSIIVFFSINSLWAYAIFKKYDHFSYTTRSRFTSLEVNENRTVMPMSYTGLVQLPDKNATSAWDDPIVFVEKKVQQWPQANNLKNFIEGTVLKNIKGFFKYQISKYQLLFFIFFIAFLFKKHKNNLIQPLIFTMVYPCGFFLFYNADRFFWPVNLMLMIAIILGFLAYFNENNKNYFFRLICLGSIVILFLFRPLGRLINEPDKKFYNLFSAIENNKSTDLMKHGRFASLNYQWDEGLYVTYAMKGLYLGECKPNSSKEEIRNQLLKFNIDYLLVPATISNKENLPTPKTTTLLNGINLTIYSYK